MDWGSLIGYVFGGTGLIAVVIRALLDRRRQSDAQLLAERAQANAQQLAEEVQATKTLQEEIARLTSRIEKLEAAHADCMQGHIEEARRSGSMEGRITEQSATIAQQSALIAQQSATIAKLQADLDTATQAMKRKD